MEIRYPILEYRDLSEEYARTFQDPGSYAKKVFICETRDSDRNLTPNGRFNNGFTVTVINKGPNNVNFIASIYDGLTSQTVIPLQSKTFIYSSHDKMWHFSDNHAVAHETGGSDELDGDHLDVDWNPNVYSPSSSIAEADDVDNLAAHLKGIDTLLGSHASRHTSGNSDEIDGDKLDIDWDASNYSPETSPSEVDSTDHLTAHLSGIDTALRTYEQVSEPSDPNAGNSVVYSSDGSASDENAGDFILKVNVGGTVKKHWLFAF